MAAEAFNNDNRIIKTLNALFEKVKKLTIGFDMNLGRIDEESTKY